MALLALGLNHDTASIDVRDRASVLDSDLPTANQELQALGAVRETAILSTCNRTELYVSLDSDEAAPVLDWWGERSGLAAQDLGAAAYQHWDRHAVEHLLRVACGLDSMVLGEPQILGQVKSAFQTARDAGSVGQTLEKLFQHTFGVAKQIRTAKPIGANSVSVAACAVELAKRIFSNIEKHQVLLIGAGETIELVARHLHAHGMHAPIVANRTVRRAESLARRFEGRGISLTQITDVLHEPDIIVTSTASPLPILGKGMLESAGKRRRHRPQLIVDLAVPRDVEPEVGNLEDVFLYSVDDLRDIIDENMASRRVAAVAAEQLVNEHVESFLAWQRSLGAVSLIRDYREHAQHMRDAAVIEAKRRLAAGEDQSEVLARMANQLTNRLLHQPTRMLHSAAVNGDQDLIDAASTLLGAAANDSENK